MYHLEKNEMIFISLAYTAFAFGESLLRSKSMKNNHLFSRLYRNLKQDVFKFAPYYKYGK